MTKVSNNESERVTSWDDVITSCSNSEFEPMTDEELETHESREIVFVYRTSSSGGARV